MKYLALILLLCSCSKEIDLKPLVIPQNIIYIDFSKSGYTKSEQQLVTDSTAALFKPFNVMVSASKELYLKVPENNRQLIVVGSGDGTGHAITGSWGTETPAFANSKVGAYMMHRVIAHEIGHTLGLRHQSLWVEGKRVSEYRNGFIMGNCLGFTALWGEGLNSIKELQNDFETIKNKLR